MTNEQYLTTSYWVVGIVSLVVGGVTCIIFRRSVAGMTQALPSRKLAVILRGLFAPVIVLAANVFRRHSAAIWRLSLLQF